MRDYFWFETEEEMNNFEKQWLCKLKISLKNIGKSSLFENF